MNSKAISITTGSAVAASTAAIAITAASSDHLTDTLAAAASYPNASGTTLADAQSWSMTYLLLFLGLGLIGWGVTARTGSRPSRFARTTALITLVVVTVFGVYNLTEPFPVAIKVAGLLPAVFGGGALIVLYGVGPTRLTR